MNKRSKNTIIILGILVLIIMLNFFPMVYNRIIGNGGTFVENYTISLSTDTLIDRIKKMKTKDKLLQISGDSIQIGEYKNGWIYVRFFDKEKSSYFHTWIENKDEFVKNKTTMIFYGVSSTSNWKDSKRINRDFDYISRFMILQRFENLIVNEIDKN